MGSLLPSVTHLSLSHDTVAETAVLHTGAWGCSDEQHYGLKSPAPVAVVEAYRTASPNSNQNIDDEIVGNVSSHSSEPLLSPDCRSRPLINKKD
jgi:hypothetical protein